MEAVSVTESLCLLEYRMMDKYQNLMIISTMMYRRFLALAPYLLFGAHTEVAIAEAARIVLAQQKILILGPYPAGGNGCNSTFFVFSLCCRV
jgi:hypothetical protein